VGVEEEAVTVGMRESADGAGGACACDFNAQWASLRAWRSPEMSDATTSTSSRASVDVFHAFLVSLRGRPEPRYQALIAALLSVQCLDKVALRAFERLRDALGGEVTLSGVRALEASTLEACVKTLNFHGSKARYIRECSDVLHFKFKGEVPHSVGALKSLPGVGDKLAHLVASVAYGGEDDFAGIVVDTHVKRVAKRIGWTSSTNPETIRLDLQSLAPERCDWEDLTLALIALGQNICASKLPACAYCPLRSQCPSSQSPKSIMRASAIDRVPSPAVH
jgi:endonuclease-3